MQGYVFWLIKLRDLVSKLELDFLIILNEFMLNLVLVQMPQGQKNDYDVTK